MVEETYHRFNVWVWNSLEYLVLKLEIRSEVNVSTLVLGGIAVLGRGENGNTTTIVLDFVALHAHLVRTNDSLQTIVLTEALGDIGTELKTNTALTGSTAWHSLRVGPEHLHHQTLLTRLSLVVTVKFADIVEGDLVIGEQTTVKNQVLITNQSGQGQSGE